jgi:putative ABC transport system ATP-binding protein
MALTGAVTCNSIACFSTRTGDILPKDETPSRPIVQIENVGLTLTSRAGPVEILRDVSLDVAAGQSLAVVGPSGSGKTSLLMVMAGLERATLGRVRIAGHDLQNLGEDDLARVRGAEIGIVFQSFHLVPTMTAIENVALPLEFAGRADAEKTAAAVLDEVGLSHRLTHYPAEMSGGEQQRVAIARALATAPKLLLADEPTGNLDGRTGQTIVDLLFDLQHRHAATLILVTHDAALAKLCQRTVRMADGRIVDDSAHPHIASGREAAR